MIHQSASFTRRSLVAGSLAAAAIAKSASAQTPESTPATEFNQYLVTGIALDAEGTLIGGIETYDGNLNQLSRMEITDGVVSFEQTGRSGVIYVMTLFGAMMVDLEQGQPAAINWQTADPGYIFPAPPVEGKNPSERYIVAQNIEMSKVLVVDLETFEGRDITEYIANEGTDVVAMVPDVPETGSLGGVWTGDNVYFIDYANPESAEPLVGDDPDWYSTTLQLSDDGTWGTFTTYDPDGDGATANCYLRNMETGEYSKIMEGNAWTTGFFIPNDPEHFIAHSPETGLEYRAIATPDEPGELIAEVEMEGGRQYWLNEGKILLYGHRVSNDAPRNWIRIDMETREVTELPDLEGQKPWWPDLAKTAPKHLLFCEDTYEELTHTLRGFDVDTGEVWVAVEEVYIEPLNGITASNDGIWYTASTPNRGTNVGVWLINMANKDAHKLEEGGGLYAEYGAVSPDGSTIAVTYLTQPDSSRVTTVASTGSPEDTTEITDAHVLGWSM